jgi:hypothetical protein
MRTEPVKFSAGPWREGCEPLRAIVIDGEDSPEAASRPSAINVAASHLMLFLLSISSWNSQFQSSFPGVTGSSRMRLPVAW